MSLMEDSLGTFLNKVSGTKNTTPAAGSVSALAASLGISLVVLAGNLTIGRQKYMNLPEEVKKEIEESYEGITSAGQRLQELIDEDKRAYDQVISAFKRHKEGKTDLKEKERELELADKGALEVPLQIARESLKALKLMEPLVKYGNPNCRADLAVSIINLHAGLEGALAIAASNLNNLREEEEKGRKYEEGEKLSLEAHRLKKELLGKLSLKLFYHYNQINRGGNDI
ncbi:MAG: formimidoyltetrahydrofolate cyclodeaminase [Candidatus Syntrophonatronum acetioxidans]|uniref:Formimidoyltetrahydrofolate cyclodeaminase n=1 Tax=Candidatus Syntrophonatronum acetioxidans TaxID=1795816 RepID=A0A424YGF1_9FIRM|nr:MAG: formimidoyltetrahydrofolate cyclodeaminase [Candidatus Syntrophonatronum acetioxidans]